MSLIDKTPAIDTQGERLAAAAKNVASVFTTAGATPAIEDDKKFISKGQKIHNEITYRGVDWILNSAFAVIFTYCSNKTEAGIKYFTEPVKKFFNVALKPIFKTPEKLETPSKMGAMFASIMIGGTAIIPVMMVLENKNTKKKIIKKIDEKIYGADEVANDPKFQESYNALDNEPKKGFVVGMVTRMLALAPILTAVLIPKSNEQLNKFIYEPIGKGTKWVGERLPISATREKMKSVTEMVPYRGNPENKKVIESNWEFLHTKVIGFDLGLTFFYSFIHEAAYKAVSAMTGGKKGKEQQNTPEDKPAPTNSTELATGLNSDNAQAASSDKKWADTVEKSAKTVESLGGSHQDVLINSSKNAETALST